MRHPAREVGSGKGIGARILGTYEMELWEIVADLCDRPHDGIVNIGAAEGYYAIGLALLKPNSRTVAFEADPEIAACLHANVRLNGVEERIRLADLCTLDDLRAELTGLHQPLVLIDVEGAERELLDPAKIPALVRSEVLVEIHDFAGPEIGAEIAARFQPTHQLTEVWTRNRTVHDIPPGVFHWLSHLLPGHGVRFLDEGRGTRMRWFHLRPLSMT